MPVGALVHHVPRGGRISMSVTLRRCEYVLDDHGTICGVRGPYCLKCRGSWCGRHSDGHAEFCAGFATWFPRSNAGRPPLVNPKCRLLSLRLTESEYQAITIAAKTAGRSTSEWMRGVLFAALLHTAPAAQQGKD